MDRDIYTKIISKIKGMGQIISGAVKDVKVNETSIVDDEGNAVLNIGAGLSFSSTGSPANRVYVNIASTQTIKQGVSNNAFTPVSRQNEGVFYGLAKAAGDSTQALSENEVGIYTQNAIDSILAMLGVSALVGRREASSTPSANIAQNEVFIYQGKLYKASDAISTSGTITPGTNCTETNLLELIGG